MVFDKMKTSSSSSSSSWRRILLLLVVVTVLLPVRLASAATVVSTLIPLNRMVFRKGTLSGITQSKDVLNVNDGSSATSGDFLEVSPGTDTKIIVDLYFKLPPSWDKYTIDITNINVLMNSRGPKFADQRRIMKVRLGKSWITIGNNSPNGEEMWAYQSMAVPTQTDMYAYFNKNGVLRLRLQSNNNFDSFDMDYIVLEIQNLSDETSPPTASPTAAPVDNGGGVTTSIRKLGECQGSCSTSFNDCAMGLSCWTNQDLTQPIPGCSNQNGRVPGANYCYNPQ